MLPKLEVIHYVFNKRNKYRDILIKNIVFIRGNYEKKKKYIT